jgi:hypothetical protein
VDIIIFLILIILVLIFVKDTKSIIIFIGLSDVLLKLIHQIKNLLNVPEFTVMVNKYIPGGIEAIISNNTEGFIAALLVWFYILIMIWFVWYLIKYLFNF